MSSAAEIQSEVGPGDAHHVDSVCRATLGVTDDASWETICAAHARLVADLTPGPRASHQRVHLALAMLDEVNEAFAALQQKAVA